MKRTDADDATGRGGLSRRRVLSLTAGATGAVLGLGALSGSAAAWQRFEVDFLGCEEARILVHDRDLTLDPPAVGRVLVAVDGEAVCRTVEITQDAATPMPNRYGATPVVRYVAADDERILGVIEYNHREDRFSEPVCVMRNDSQCATDAEGPAIADAECVQAGVEGHWEGEVQECWFDPLRVDGALGQARQRQRLVPAGAAAGDRAGYDLAANGDGTVLLVGVPGEHGSPVPGAVAVYRHRDGEWTQTATLTVDDASVYQLGQAVAVDASGDVALVGADGGRREDDGSDPVHVFTFDGTDWSRTGELGLAADQLLEDEIVHGFGAELALDAAGDTAVIGAPLVSRPGIHEGEAYIFERDGGGWQFEGRGRETFGEAIQFGHGSALSADGRRAAMGAPVFEWTSVSPAGWVRLADRTDGGWAPSARLEPADAEPTRDVGVDVAIDAAGETVVAGDWRRDVHGRENEGCAVVFEQQDGDWSRVTTLTTSDGVADDGLGTAVATDAGGTVALVGAPGTGFGTDPGTDAAYRFEKRDGTWRQTAKLQPAAGAADDSFGQAVALDDAGEVSICGAPRATVDGVESGAVYVFTR